MHTLNSLQSNEDVRRRRLRQEMESLRQETKHRVRINACIIILMVAVCSFVDFNWIAFVGFMIVSFVMMDKHATVESRRNEIATSLSSIADPSALDSLIQSWKAADSRVKPLLENGIRVALNGVSAEDRSHLSNKTIHSIPELFISEDTRLVVAALKALEFIGDTSSLRAVRSILMTNRSEWFRGKFVYGPVFSPWSAQRPDIVARARRVAAVIESRVAEERNESMLLRPSGEVQTDNLLRPSAMGSADSTVQLLRPSEVRERANDRNSDSATGHQWPV